MQPDILVSQTHPYQQAPQATIVRETVQRPSIVNEVRQSEVIIPSEREVIRTSNVRPITSVYRTTY